LATLLPEFCSSDRLSLPRAKIRAVDERYRLARGRVPRVRRRRQRAVQAQMRGSRRKVRLAVVQFSPHNVVRNGGRIFLTGLRCLSIKPALPL
jgi:hypothetical protein